MHDDRPRLVPLEPRQVSLEGGATAFALHDPLGVLEGTAVVSPAAYWVLAHLDGSRTVSAVVAALLEAGVRVSPADVDRVVEQARAAGLVHGPTYDRKRARVVASFRAGPRAPVCAGGAYPDDPRDLDAMLAGFFAHPEGPGARTPGLGGRDLRLLVAPHIDFLRGGPSYAHAYGALDGCAADLFVILGTAHASPPHLFTLTRQPFATPLGEVPVDRAAADALVAALGEEELLADELVHVGEHSVEFQVVWLRWLLGPRPFTILPVLCSSISHLADPDAATRPFLEALAKATAGRHVCFVAGADLAHAGPMYGDDAPVSRAALDGLGAEDLRTLAFLERGDAPGFHRDAIVDDARRRLCGVAPIYAAMRAAGRGGRLLHHGQWWDGADSVSFCAAAG
jgi:AmmeMemoRadiSam system protein B